MHTRDSQEMADIRRLWTAVLRQALEDALMYKKTKNNPLRGNGANEKMQAFREGYRWIMWRDPGFIGVCEVIGLCPEKVRRTVRELDIKHLRSLRPGPSGLARCRGIG